MAQGNNCSLAGVHAILNPDVIKPGIDLKELERSIRNAGYVSKPSEPAPADKLDAELQQFAKHIGLDLDNNTKQQTTTTTTVKPTTKPLVAPKLDSDSESESDDESSSDSSSDSDNDTTPFYIHSDIPKSSTKKNKSSKEVIDASDDESDTEDSYLSTTTKEQRRKAQINAAIGYDDSGVDFESEKQEDAKCNMLAQIDDVRCTLLDDGIDISRIPEVTMKNSYNEIENTLRILQYKFDHNRYRTFAEEVCLFAVAGLEEVFDGKKTYLGKRPNLKGYKNHANVKIRRMRPETGRLISGIMKDNNINPWLRLALEFIPSMTLYSMAKQEEEEYND